MTAVAVASSGLHAVIAALAAGRDVPPASRRAAVCASPEDERPAPTAVGTGQAHSFDTTNRSDEEVIRA